MTGQFLSIDPELATSTEPYVYANDDPTNRKDPTGAYPLQSNHGVCGDVEAKGTWNIKENSDSIDLEFSNLCFSADAYVADWVLLWFYGGAAHTSTAVSKSLLANRTSFEVSTDIKPAGLGVVAFEFFWTFAGVQPYYLFWTRTTTLTGFLEGGLWVDGAVYTWT